MTLAAPQRVLARVRENRPLTPEVFRIALETREPFARALPGQFVQVECLPGDPALPRPFSVSRSRDDRGQTGIELVYGVVGRCTRALSRRREGEEIHLLGPLGRPFRPVKDRFPVLAGGGRGIAPLVGLAASLSGDFPRGVILYGARSREQLIPLGDLPYPLELATDDGSAGRKGTVVTLLEEWRGSAGLAAERLALYACGPNRMLAALSAWAAARQVPCQVSIETHFGCGFGICAGCAVPVHASGDGDAFSRVRFACVDGPVMEGSEVEWEGVAE